VDIFHLDFFYAKLNTMLGVFIAHKYYYLQLRKFRSREKYIEFTIKPLVDLECQTEMR